METLIKKLYEAMFLVDSAQAQSDWDAVITTIKNILERAEAEIVSIKKWDERKLAYEINGRSRGTYILCYFRAEGSRIAEIERDVQLSEQIMRVLILCADHIREEDIEQAPILRGPLQKERKMGTQEDTPAARVEKRKQKPAQQAAEEAEAGQLSAQQEVQEAEELKQSVAEPEGDKE